jgi:Protein of unknown function DUF262
MKYEPRDYKIADLVEAWRQGQLLRNDEYQRGAAWSRQQQQGLIDSVFRKYPIPPLFIHRIAQKGGLGSGTNERFEIVDGQQRIRALSDFISGKFPSLAAHDKKLRLPTSMRQRPAPWAGRAYADLTDELQTALNDTLVPVYLIDAAQDDDEIRDLFIRLQAGTALGRQQIRDAWPGRIGPFINKLSGKMDRVPSCGLFATVDMRGQRADDEGETDEYVADRQTCAQLLRIFLARESDPSVFPSVAAADLDALYHDNTTFDDQGHAASRFKESLETADKVVQKAIDLRRANDKGGHRKKFKKLEVFAVVALIQDLTRNPNFKVTSDGIKTLADQMVSEARANEPAGKISSGRSIAIYYEWWRENVARKLPGVRMDPQRIFSDAQREEIRNRDAGNCRRCGEAVAAGDAEYDHSGPVSRRRAYPS